jgi:hypothetical protein
LAPIIAPLGTLQDRCIAAPGLIAAVIVGKYVDHLPLYRQEQIFTTRQQVMIPRQTMAQWMGLAADWLRPIYEHIRTGVLGGGYVQVDKTPIEDLAPGRDETKLGYLWTCARRAIYQARESGPRTVGWLLRQIGLLYDIEDQLRQAHAGPAPYLWLVEAALWPYGSTSVRIHSRRVLRYPLIPASQRPGRAGGFQTSALVGHTAPIPHSPP